MYGKTHRTTFEQGRGTQDGPCTQQGNRSYGYDVYDRWQAVTETGEDCRLAVVAVPSH